MLPERLELRVPPVVVTAIAATVIVAIERSTIASVSTRGTAPALGTALAAAGLVVAVAGVIAFRRARTTVDPRHPERSARLVTAGVFRFSRNPMYLGFVAALLGLAVALSSPIGVVVALAAAAFLDRFQIQPEERTLVQRFGDEFESYRRSVRRWL